MSDNRISVNGIKIYPFKNIDELLEVATHSKKILIAINAGKIYNATDETRELINNNIGYIDGVGAQKAVQKKGAKDAIRIPGCDLWLEIISRTYKNGGTYYFVGAKQEIIDKVISRLKTDFPGINILNYRNGFISSSEEKKELLDDICSRKPKYVFVAMGSPKQELLMKKMAEIHPAVYQGLGGSFDVYVGKMKRAPEWYIRHNLEGIYRVFSNLNKARIKRLLKDMRCMINIYLGKY